MHAKTENGQEIWIVPAKICTMPTEIWIMPAKFGYCQRNLDSVCEHFGERTPRFCMNAHEDFGNAYEELDTACDVLHNARQVSGEMPEKFWTNARENSNNARERFSQCPAKCWIDAATGSGFYDVCEGEVVFSVALGLQGAF